MHAHIHAYIVCRKQQNNKKEIPFLFLPPFLLLLRLPPPSALLPFFPSAIADRTDASAFLHS
jgi:hypothetical protein